VITSTAGGYTAKVDNGIVTLYLDGSASLVVGLGTSVQLLDSDSLYLFWITTAGVLQRSTVTQVSGAIVLTATAALASNVTGFFAKDIPGYGLAYAYITGLVLHINILGSSYLGTWGATRLPDFTFDISPDLSTLSVLYMKPGSPTQAFVDYYGTETIFVETIAMLRLYDFELGAHTLEPHVASVT